jgi:hypothetical protein
MFDVLSAFDKLLKGMKNMEDVQCCKNDHNNSDVSVKKGNYECARDVCVASLAYLLKLLQYASKELYMHSMGKSVLGWITRNITP